MVGPGHGHGAGCLDLSPDVGFSIEGVKVVEVLTTVSTPEHEALVERRDEIAGVHVAGPTVTEVFYHVSKIGDGS